ncbi:GntR family transcriptional regulator [Streptomyces sp. NBC_00841]|uniref:GntR family transcriptional regulator n=1 Tax=Streptomyces sp. NBC_00841 TaxID=2975847 RepID=UPI002DDB12CD|nr:winged helix-turn-helix domain-containing protein [Streptomyces sp. NBC_00841]
MTVDPSSPEYVYVQVADAIAADIAAGKLPRGARLPNERDLATSYGIAVGTARRAVEELRQRGLVRTVPAKGTYVQ